MGEPVNVPVPMSDDDVDRIARGVAKIVLKHVCGAPGARLASAGDGRHPAAGKALDSIPPEITRLGTGAGGAGMRNRRGAKVAVPPAGRYRGPGLVRPPGR